jgi:proline iminopeptidase
VPVRLRADDGVHLWVATTGAEGGVPMVLAHGGPGLWDNLEPLAALVDDVAVVHRWDQRGCGRSDRVGPYTVARMVADMEVVRLHAGVDRWVVAGHSWGALLALYYAVTHPGRLLALVYLSGNGMPDSWVATNRMLTREEEARRTTAEQRGRRDELAAMPARTVAEERELRLLSWCADVAPGLDASRLLAADLDAPWEISFEANASLGADGRARVGELRAGLGRVDVPALVVHGVHDPRPLAGAEEVASLLPRARLVTLDTGHTPWIEDPAASADVVRAFLCDVAAG